MVLVECLVLRIQVSKKSLVNLKNMTFLCFNFHTDCVPLFPLPPAHLLSILSSSHSVCESYLLTLDRGAIATLGSKKKMNSIKLNEREQKKKRIYCDIIKQPI